MISEAEMIRAAASQHIAAPAERVFALYADPANWPSVFPTIRAVHVVSDDGRQRLVDVEHVEGSVVNVVRLVSPSRIVREEWQPRYDVTFVSEFLPEDGGTCHRVTADVSLKGWYRLVAPFAKPLIRAQLRRRVLAPLKEAAEEGVERLQAG